jgi:hypothetical protein
VLTRSYPPSPQTPYAVATRLELQDVAAEAASDSKTAEESAVSGELSVLAELEAFARSLAHSTTLDLCRGPASLATTSRHAGLAWFI